MANVIGKLAFSDTTQSPNTDDVSDSMTTLKTSVNLADDCLNLPSSTGERIRDMSKLVQCVWSVVSWSSYFGVDVIAMDV